MKNQVMTIFAALVMALASRPSFAMSELISSVGRGGGLLEVTLAAGDLPPRVTVFSHCVLRFVGIHFPTFADNSITVLPSPRSHLLISTTS